MRVEPKTEAEIQTMNLREAGEYDFAVVDATEKLSTKGSDMAAEYMVGRAGRCKVAIQPAKGQYQAKNIVSDYLGGSDEKAPKQLVDDEIPF
jgi:hypothetical protein